MNLKNDKYSDYYWMRIALEEAELAVTENEIPIGAVLIKDNEIISRTHNRTKKLQSSLAHAEKLVIEKAQKKLGNWLYGCTLYVTLEPCPMCAGIIILARIEKLVFATFDTKTGVCGSLYNLLKDRRFNHNPDVISGIYSERSEKLLKEFFKNKRIKQ